MNASADYGMTPSPSQSVTPSRATWIGFALLPIVAALCGIGTLRLIAPAYSRQGFPLDDAWIHAVYARELARTAMLAYNPHLPATGETSPLWAVVLAIPHRLADDSSAAVTMTKAVGFLLHLAAAVVIALAIASGGDRRDVAPWLGGALVGFHPDLLAASVSGMEVPLASLVVAALALAIVKDRPAWVATFGAAAALARPETPVFAVFALGLRIRTEPRAALKSFAAATGGAVAAMTVMGVRNLIVSGRPLPATFYVKANVITQNTFTWQVIGFQELFGCFALVNQPMVLIALTACSLVMVARGHHSGARGSLMNEGRVAAALFLSAIVFCAVSFALVHPIDPGSFYHQRYLLPALVPMVAALPALIREVFKGIGPKVSAVALAVAVVLMAAALVRAAPPRYRRLSNDAQNIDDVQVAFGKVLGRAKPSAVAWVVDAGASRYFGRAFVVDLVGLNTFELLGRDAQAFLDSHQPRYLDQFADWIVVRGDGLPPMPARNFTSSAPYTVTSFPRMRQHTLVTCVPPGQTGSVRIRDPRRDRFFAFRCPAWNQ